MTYLADSRIEIIRDVPRGAVRHALFDFDGTISLIRQGWQDVMVPLMIELLAETPRHEPLGELSQIVTEFIARTTGKQTIYQMIGLRDMIAQRGGEPREALAYKRIYLDRLWVRIQDRVAGLKAGRLTPEELSVPGALEMLPAVAARGVTCYLASGTDKPYVEDEVAALGVSGFFSGGIHGALDAYETYSKAMVIGDILCENALSGEALAVFGDGFVEIENAKDAGGIAVGVASDEAKRQGIDAWKRERLIGAGADIIVPDFREHDRLLAYLFGEE